MALALTFGCATSAPKALVEAHERFEQDVKSDSAQRDAVGLWNVKGSLERADQINRDQPGSPAAEAAARKALTDVHRWEWMAQIDTLDSTMERVANEADVTPPLQATRAAPRRTESEERIGALGLAVGTFGEVRQEAGVVKVRFANGALFDRGERDLKLAARARLELTGDALRRYPDARVRVVASTEYAQGDALAGLRAAQVREVLIEAGVPAQNVTATGHGGEEGRVEIVVQPLDVPPVR
ncbi:MAG: OmpA family protein [Myxococcaceae bacterium]